MSTTLRTLPMVAKLVLVVGLLCGVIFTQAGYSQSAAIPCNASAQAHGPVARPVSCQDCCAAMPCCLLSKTAPGVPAHPEPLSNERNSQRDHAPVAGTLTLIPTFDFLAPTPAPRVLARERVAESTWGSAPRSAVSCIWLI